MRSLNNNQYNLITGIVVQGKQLGRTIGFPTANIEPFQLSTSSIPKGVYGVYVYFEKEQYIGVMNVGERPTFEDGNHLTYEIHILDFNDHLYGKELTVEIAFFVRNEKKFPSLPDLIKQLQQDVYYTSIHLKKQAYVMGG